jgi:type I site-specific restriction endonuclease
LVFSLVPRCHGLVGSMTEFKQIVGRGRVHEDTKKFYFTLI